RIEKNRLVREIVIRKARGSPLTIARVPFAITEKGLRVWAPPNLETIPALEESRTFKMPCEVVSKYIGDLYGGTNVYISYPPDARPPRILGFTLLTGYINRARTLVITYRTPPSQIKQIIFTELVKRACPDKGMESLRKYAENLVEYESFNPSSFSLEELYNRILYLIEKRRPDMVVFLGSDVLPLEERKHYDIIMNLLLYLKLKGILVFNLGAHSSDLEYMVYSRFADVVARYIFYHDTRDDKIKYKLYLWKVGKDPIVLSYEQLGRCNLEMASLLNTCNY
ncbi:MAG: hypothetical protein GSR82_02860, partial [Desulfurococcales archaeon]|nr:hypothetical protein [Desulfurococcales archaeon]